MTGDMEKQFGKYSASLVTFVFYFKEIINQR